VNFICQQTDSRPVATRAVFPGSSRARDLSRKGRTMPPFGVKRVSVYGARIFRRIVSGLFAPPSSRLRAIVRLPSNERLTTYRTLSSYPSRSRFAGWKFSLGPAGDAAGARSRRRGSSPRNVRAGRRCAGGILANIPTAASWGSGKGARSRAGRG
jgi:hypothetical protein